MANVGLTYTINLVTTATKAINLVLNCNGSASPSANGTMQRDRSAVAAARAAAAMNGGFVKPMSGTLDTKNLVSNHSKKVYL